MVKRSDKGTIQADLKRLVKAQQKNSPSGKLFEGSISFFLPINSYETKS